MTDETGATQTTQTTTQTGSEGAATKPNGEGKETTTTQNQTTQAPTFDTAKISDADFAKVFDDPRTFQHSRFKELAEDAKAGKAAKDAEAKRQQDEAIKKGEFDKVLSEKDGKITELSTKLTTTIINQNLIIAASKLGAVDTEAVLALVDRSKLSFDDATQSVKGVEEALKALSETKQYLFGKQGTQRLGSASNPNQNNTGDLKRFKHSEIKDPVFYREHEQEILASMKAGLIENDL